MSANAEVFRRAESVPSPVERDFPLRDRALNSAGEWSRENYALEQMRSLVRQVFLGNVVPPRKQVAISAAEAETDAADVCDAVGRTLALETGADVAVVTGEQSLADRLRPHSRFGRRVTIKSWSKHGAANLWHVPRRAGHEYRTGLYWLSFLAELRNEFEYSVILAPAAGTSSEAALIGQMTDGIVLVLGAHSTRKATARKIKENLVSAQCHIVATVLSERRFPIPGWIYRRL
jgi:hypothetical protein